MPSAITQTWPYELAIHELGQHGTPARPAVSALTPSCPPAALLPAASPGHFCLCLEAACIVSTPPIYHLSELRLLCGELGTGTQWVGVGALAHGRLHRSCPRSTLAALPCTLDPVAGQWTVELVFIDSRQADCFVTSLPFLASLQISLGRRPGLFL